MQQRDNSLDALRGLAILAMVLSSSIAFGILPAWMYHAQEPPPSHVFMPELPGISWVDLVFPFFLFSMGAAIPLALNRKVKEGASFGQVLLVAVRRYALLVFFALFTMHARSIVVNADPEPVQYLLQLAAFILLCFMLYKPAGLSLLSFLAAGALLYLLPFKDGKGFSLYRSDIIILVLANMALAGTIIWWCTRNNPWLRMGILPFVMAILLGGKAPGSWNEAVLQWSPAPWMYQFYYLKYLFILLPGTLAGEWLLKYNVQEKSTERSHTGLIAATGIAIIVTNVICLFNRYLLLNLSLTIVFCGWLYWLTRTLKHPAKQLLSYFFKAGTYLLLLGLFTEAYEGGIKKDPSTFSYYFVTGGLAFFLLMTFYTLQLRGVATGIIRYFSLNGRNPMVAYVTGNLLLLPLLRLSGGMAFYLTMQQHVFTGFLSGVLFTGIVSAITVLFTKRGWFWKT